VWWEQAWYDKTKELDKSFASADTSTIKFSRTSNNWKIDIYDKVGALVFSIEVDGDINFLDGKGIGLLSGARISFDDQSTDEIEITSGIVGIGTTAPEAALDINHATGDMMQFSYNDADGSPTDYATFALAADGLLTITTVDADAAEADISFMPDGNVGIGTVTPTHKLEIVGHTKLRGFTFNDTLKVTRENPTDNYILKYDAATDSLEWEADAGGTNLKDAVATSPLLIDGGTNVDDVFPGSDADLTWSVTVAKDIVATSPLTVNAGASLDNVIIGTDADITIAPIILKDLVTTAPLTGAVNDAFLGTDADITIAIDVLKDIVTTAPVTGGTDNVLPGSDSDITIALTLLKDVVATAPITVDGGTNVNDILPGSDADLTFALAADGIKDTHIDWGTGANQVSMKDIEPTPSRFFTFAVDSANGLTADTTLVFYNGFGASMTIDSIRAMSDLDDYAINVIEINQTGGGNSLIDALVCSTNGQDWFYDFESTISGATIESEHWIGFATPASVGTTITIVVHFHYTRP